MTWLLTGGAGYIGSHIVQAFRAAGRDVVVLDDLSSGFREFVPDDVVLHEGRVEDPAAVAVALDAQPLDGVIHLAGLKYAGESVHRPLDFYRANVEGTRALLEAMAARDIDRLVFSSSSATYGTAEDEVVAEGAPQRPESPYGESKLIGEWLIRDQARARPSLRHTSLRYFNVVGAGTTADPEGAERATSLVDHSPYNLFPLVFRALSRDVRPKLFGDDYPTPDGSCIRDYVDVVDLAEAHLRAATLLDDGIVLAPAYNVGRGEGVSVRQILDAILAHVDGNGPDGYDVEPRRAGDPARIVGSAALIERDFGWKPSRDLDDMVAGAWRAWTADDSAAREAGADAARA